MKEIKGTKAPMAKAEAEAPRRILPSFTLTTDDLPELRNWEVGKNYYLKIKVEQTNLGKGQNEWETTAKEEKKRYARFQMLGVEVIENKENFEDEYARKRSRASRQ